MMIKFQDRAKHIGTTIKSPKSQEVFKRHGSLLLMLAILAYDSDLLIPMLLVRFGADLIKITKEELDDIDYDQSTMEKLVALREKYIQEVKDGINYSTGAEHTV